MKKVISWISFILVLFLLFYAGGLLSNRRLLDGLQKDILNGLNYLRNLKN